MAVNAIATDLAEFLGASLAFNLLFGLSLLEGALLTGLSTYLALLLHRLGFRLMEIVIGAMIMAVALGFLLEMVLSRPEPYLRRCAADGGTLLLHRRHLVRAGGHARLRQLHHLSMAAASDHHAAGTSDYEEYFPDTTCFFLSFFQASYI